MHLIVSYAGRHPAVGPCRCRMTTGTGGIGCDLSEVIDGSVIDKISAMTGSTGAGDDRRVAAWGKNGPQGASRKVMTGRAGIMDHIVR